MTPENVPYEPFFLDGTAGRLFALYFPPIGEPRGNVLCIPPFAEESNRCRVMIGMQARQLSLRGYGTLVLDPFGTGNSEGEFGDADWETWQDDVQRGIDWLTRKESPLVLWGIRLSAILVHEAAQSSPDSVSRLLFWQPVINAKLAFTQFLRIRVAHALEHGNRNETTKELRAMINSGQSVDVAGYTISPSLGKRLDQLGLAADNAIAGMRLDWLEHRPEEQQEFAKPTLSLHDNWQERGMDIALHPFDGPAFWQLHERFLAPDLIQKTTTLFN